MNSAITEELKKSHTSKEARQLFSLLTRKKVDNSFGLFTPFYTNFGKNIKIGKNVFINACCSFYDNAGIEIKDNCFIGQNVVIDTLNPTKSSVTIEKNVWIGDDTKILSGVTIGENSIIGKNSVVINNIPPNCVCLGNPCRVIKKIIKK